MPDSDALALSDRELLSRTRAGDRDAYGELWRRHAASGRTVARSYSSLDADDVVAEAFTRIYQTLLSGRGPRDAFRPYLFTTIRNTAAGWGRASREHPLDTLESVPDPASGDDSWLVALDGSAAAQAFRALPPRWQEILWYTEVEGMSPQDAALLIGRSPNSTSALAYRAREGLRQAWITAHLRTVEGRPDCEWTVGRLAGWVRGRLGAREVRRLEGHLDGCTDCTLAAAEARTTGSRLALALLPLVAGSGAATAYAEWMRRGEAAADAVAAGAPPSIVFEAGPSPVLTTAGSAAAPASASGAPGASGVLRPRGSGAHAASTASSGPGVIGSIAGVFLGVFIAAATVAATLNLPSPASAPSISAEAGPGPEAIVPAEPAEPPASEEAASAEPPAETAPPAAEEPSGPAPVDPGPEAPEPAPADSGETDSPGETEDPAASDPEDLPGIVVAPPGPSKPEPPPRPRPSPPALRPPASTAPTPAAASSTLSCTAAPHPTPWSNCRSPNAAGRPAPTPPAPGARCSTSSAPASTPSRRVSPMQPAPSLRPRPWRSRSPGRRAWSSTSAAASGCCGSPAPPAPTCSSPSRTADPRRSPSTPPASPSSGAARGRGRCPPRTSHSPCSAARPCGTSSATAPGRPARPSSLRRRARPRSRGTRSGESPRRALHDHVDGERCRP
ncbi:sigma-70 family RNA polymerase sigma factor [Agromyces archimandritae]|uniref:Sigma-70 family RNA polymerase sigma factor n=1 Tax=Agromyces archimandritae TaxID=2781962 RepID=A0A975FM06_9MICO|nr:sigma-70 family RNA polymerase sigma factor [Agromyces archimandritae]